MHVPHEVVHLGQRARRLVHDEVDAVVERLEVVVGDERRDLDDHVTVEVEAGHLEIEPAPIRSPVHRWAPGQG